MKQVTLILIALSFSNLILSQISWAPSGAKWIYEWGNAAGYTAYVQIEYKKDSIILGKDSKILSKTLYLWNGFINKIEIFNLGNEYSYAEDSVVFLYTYDKFDTLYSFNSRKGDSWILYCYPNSGLCDTNATVTIIDTGSKTVNNINLKYIAVEYDYNFGGIHKYKDTIIERIGSIGLYILPWDRINEFLDGNEGGPLRCYSDNEIGTYSNNFNKPCDYLVSINQSHLNGCSFFPNPSSDFIQFELTGFISKELNIHVLDTYGRTILIDNITHVSY